jgi:hypothetical protein
MKIRYLLSKRAQILARLHRNTVIDPRTGCWIYTGSINGGKNGGGGYGCISMRSPGRDKPVSMLVHRLAWLMWSGRVPRINQVHHSCPLPIPRRRCWSPDHLMSKTPSANCIEREARKRANRNV